MKKIRKIVFLTGTRADFGKLKPLMDKVEHSAKFDCYTFVTGMHTLSKYGSTFEEVQNSGYKNTFVFMNQTHTTDQDTILANTITGFSNFVKEVSPDMIVIHGDRVETIAGAIVGSFNNILVSHVEGGEISGTIDEIIRHAVTKLSHIHFVANEKARDRLLQMGESKDNIWIIGSPDIDVMRSKKLPTIQQVKKHYEIPFKNYSVLIFHPVVTEIPTLRHQAEELVSAVIDSKKNYVVIYPNNDTGTEIILNEYKRFNKKNFKIFPSIRFEYFLTLLKNSKFIIGNSSAGVREAEVFGVPAINIGSRQRNRTKNIEIENTEANKKQILRLISKAENKKVKKNSYFGKVENSSEKFFQIINGNKVWKSSIQKQFIDLNMLRLKKT